MEPHKEHNIQNEIRLWCGQHNILCFRCNVGRVRTPDGKYFDTGLPSGFSDLIILPGNGIIYFCECKTAIGKQREDQKQFESIVTSHGYKYFIARNVKDVEVMLNGNI